MTLVAQITSALQREVARLPEGFYDTFAYTVTGKNLTHPITLGTLSKILSSMPNVEYVAIDFRLNQANTKFQPDLVALSQIEPLQPVLFLDYESPNSSDMRIPIKDVNAYEAWSKVEERRLPYFIITTLPDRTVANWELRYTAKGQCNAKFRGRRKDICRNPFRFWYDEYRKALRQQDLSEVYFINIDAKTVKHVHL